MEANNVRAWRTAPTQCLRHIENYMTGGQYERDLNFIMEPIESYIDTIQLSDDGLDAWILDVDDTCISNVFYYRGKRFGYVPVPIYMVNSTFIWSQIGTVYSYISIYSNF